MLEVEFFSHPLQQRSRNCTYAQLFVCMCYNGWIGLCWQSNSRRVVEQPFMLENPAISLMHIWTKICNLLLSSTEFPIDFFNQGKLITC